MKNNQYIIYTRVSTQKQGDSGVSLDAQIQTCRNYIKSQNGLIIGEYSDKDTGSSTERIGLNQALADAKLYDATVVFAKLDRMVRDEEYAHRIKNSGVKLHFCDTPEVTDLLFGVLATVAANELRQIRKRTKEGLKQIQDNIDKYGFHKSKKSGRVITKLGNPNIEDVQSEGAEAAGAAHRARKEANEQWQQSFKAAVQARREGKTIQEITDYLNMIGLKNSKGNSWSWSGVRYMLADV